MKNIDFENCNNFKIRNKWIFFVLFYNRANITDAKTQEKEEIFYFLRLFSNYRQETSLCIKRGHLPKRDTLSS